MIKRKKGQTILDIFVFIIIIFVALIFFAAWKYGFNQLSTSIISVETPANDLNLSISNAATNTFGYVDTGLNALNLIGLCLIIGMVLSILISNFLVKANQVFFIVYLFIVILGVIFAVIISNVYEDLYLTSAFGNVLGSYTASTYIMLHLPTWIAIIGFIGAVLLFSAILRDRGQGGGF